MSNHIVHVYRLLNFNYKNTPTLDYDVCECVCNKNKCTGIDALLYDGRKDNTDNVCNICTDIQQTIRNNKEQ